MPDWRRKRMTTPMAAASNKMEVETERRQVEDEEEEEVYEKNCDAPSHHPFAPSNELFDIATTVDPGYIISLIRKLIPTNMNTGSATTSHLSDAGQMEGSKSEDYAEPMVIVDYAESCHQESKFDHYGTSAAGEEVWEECGCILWDLAASKANAELMVHNLILDVLLANLVLSQSVRVTEICLGIIGNLACHEGLMKHIVSKGGLVKTILNQLFLDDTQCLCEAFRLFNWGLQGDERIILAEELKSEHIISRILWIAENTLSPHLIEKSIGLLLSILESQQELMAILLQPLMKLGLPSLLIRLFTFEMGRLKSEKSPERYSALDVILRAIEALSVIDGHSHEICSSEELFKLACELIKLPYKHEIATSCVTAAVLLANILSDVPNLISEISHDLTILQGMLDTLPLASDDVDARTAVWSTISRLLNCDGGSETSLFNLEGIVVVLSSKWEQIEDDFLEGELDNYDARSLALGRIINILNQWRASKDMLEIEASDAKVDRLLECTVGSTSSRNLGNIFSMNG